MSDEEFDVVVPLMSTHTERRTYVSKDRYEAAAARAERAEADRDRLLTAIREAMSEGVSGTAHRVLAAAVEEVQRAAAPEDQTIIRTRSGSVYRYDPNARTVTWSDRAYRDVNVILLEPGMSFIYEGVSDGRDHRTLRRTSPVVSIAAAAPEDPTEGTHDG